ncbi:LTA synthase family protein [Candidatus Enterococcus courvalinii]|uniref:Sulfatase-like hydrolase/transferase n=1 Tax=Candidatus Enterococcus courvalinii TaxID=2815329 RepID=A0ABS3HWA9_9ENTE|nr:LTA synthase family protein [Enterococcus sp. MSG2901]MBO0480754.1 sulfatase-like hydrolase/transferase [Enterococcus sp. MSG2901]
MKKRISNLSLKQKSIIRISLTTIGVIILVALSNLFLQWCQNDLSYDLALKFAFSWHTEKFILACLVLFVFLAFLSSVAGSVLVGSILYTTIIGILGIADYLKMSYRQEPIYPDDIKMITELGLLREMAGSTTFFVLMGIAGLAIILFAWALYRSFKKGRRFQLVRGTIFVLSIILLLYIGSFNNPNNLLRKAYNKTALWIPYSQKMNYYNTGFIGGFLYNLQVEAMDEPKGYSKEKVAEITKNYQKIADKKNQTVDEEQPNIVYVMSESFSDPSHLNGIEVSGNPLQDYYDIANQTYSGKMLSQNYGGGTANIEFEALTGFSMELFNAQLTTPYTMLVPKMTKFPSLVSNLAAQNYQTTAIHPYNTSMYKREDVYDVLGFDSFISEKEMKYTEKLQNNPYISDKAAYQEVLSILKQQDSPQFVHLVTMQTHMPYGGKYPDTTYDAQTSDGSDTDNLTNYLQDVAYSSEALKEFVNSLQDVSRRTLVVFWGDHLPGIYSETIQGANDEQTLHETQFLMFDSAGKLTSQATHDAISSPFYFAANLLEQTNQATTGFYQLLLDVEKVLPAFERGLYYQNGQWRKEAQLNEQQQKLYEDYQMIQYDIVSGKQYSLQDGFFEK